MTRIFQGIGIVAGLFFIAGLLWVATACLISYTIQRYFQLKEEHLNRLSGEVLEEAVKNMVQQIH